MRKRNLFGTTLLSFLLVFIAGVLIAFFQLYQSIDLLSEEEDKELNTEIKRNGAQAKKKIDLSKLQKQAGEVKSQKSIDNKKELEEKKKTDRREGYYEIIEKTGRERNNEYLKKINRLRNIERVNPETLGVQVENIDESESSQENDETENNAEYIEPKIQLLNPGTLKLKSTEVIRSLNKRVFRAAPKPIINDDMIPDADEESNTDEYLEYEDK